MLQNILPTISYPSAYSNWLDLALHFSEENKELAICGDLSQDYAKKIKAMYLPNVILAGSKTESKLPFLKDRFDAGQNLFYLCQNQSCAAQTTDFEAIISKLI